MSQSPATAGSRQTQVQTRAVTDDEAGMRLDRWFQHHFPELSHGALQKLLRTGQVRIDGKRTEGKDRVEPGQSVRLPPGVTNSPPPKPKASATSTVSDRDAAEIQSMVIHRDDHVIGFHHDLGIRLRNGPTPAAFIGVAKHHLLAPHGADSTIALNSYRRDECSQNHAFRYRIFNLC